nr:hypothetical protein HAGR004_19270 [Bdellovibrio sp. HAGR004]
MARTKKISDSEVLIKAFDVISREGFESFTFEQVAKVTKLSPAALVKRFKNKQRLALLARNQKWDENLKLMDPQAIDHLHGLDGLYEFLRIIAASVDSKRLGEHLRWLGTEAQDIRARKKVGVYFNETRHILQRLLNEAIKNKELRRIENPADFAMTLEALVQGSIFQFAYLNESSIEHHLRERIKSALHGYFND